MHPQGCQILSLDPLLFGFNHMPVNWCIRQDSHLQTLRSKRSVIVISPRIRKWGRWRDSHSRGAMRPAVYETAAVAAEPHRRNGGSPRCCPVLCGLRDRCIAAMLATRTRREGSGCGHDLQRLHHRRPERPRHVGRGRLRYIRAGSNRELCSRITKGSRTPRQGNNAGGGESFRLRFQFLSRWPISSGGGLQNRRGWCDSSTGFQPSLFELRLGEPFLRA